MGLVHVATASKTHTNTAQNKMEFPRTRGRTNLKVWLLYGEVAVLDETRRYRKLKLPQGQNPARGTISRNIVSYLGEPAA